jgi:hypothetical protein
MELFTPSKYYKTIGNKSKSLKPNRKKKLFHKNIVSYFETYSHVLGKVASQFPIL